MQEHLASGNPDTRTNTYVRQMLRLFSINDRLPCHSFDMRPIINRFLCLPLLGIVACGGSTSTPWKSDSATVRGPDGQVDERAIDTSECGGKGAADVYVDANGKVLDTICYPPAGGDGVVTTVSGNTDTAPVIGNGDVVVLDGQPALSGDLTLDGNNVTLWGDDPATSVLDGNLDVTKNNVLVSGVTITGNVLVTFNDAQFSNCVIEGNLTLEGNNAKVAGCVVKGNIEVRGNNNALTANSVRGNIEDAGQNTVCEDNYRGESLATGEALTCGGK
jgi:hypothetical protein